MVNFHNIIEGWRNSLFPSRYIREVSAARLVICRGCEFNSRNQKGHFLRRDEHCTDCGCTLSAKTKCLSCCCELEEPKWECVLTEEGYINEDKERHSIKEDTTSALH